MTIVLLVFLAVSSIVGTVVPQNQAQDIYLNAYGSVFFCFFDFFDFFDMYHSWWFRFLLVLLAVNIFVCTMNKLPGVWKLIFYKKKKKSVRKVRKFSQIFEFTTDKDSKVVSNLCHSVVADKYKNVSKSKAGEFTIIEADSGRWTKLGVHIVHLSIVLLLIGGLLGSIFGFEGYVQIAEGESTNSIRLKGSNESRMLDFDICCDEFDVEFYKDGTPKEYTTKLILVRDGVQLYEKSIVVNDPIRFNGINIFQSSYGKFPSLTGQKLTLPEKIKVVFMDETSGDVFVKEMRLGVPVVLPKNLGKFCILKFLPDAGYSGIDIGPSFEGFHSSSDGKFSEKVLLPIRFPSFDKMRKNALFISLSDQFCNEVISGYGFSYYTGLQVTKDPGKHVVYLGFFFMIFGFIVTFFISYKQIYIEIENCKKWSGVIMTGYASRNRKDIDSIFRKIHDSVESYVPLTDI